MGVEGLTRCPRCRLEIIRGHDPLFGEITLDPTPLDPLGELGAVLTQRQTYTVRALLGARPEARARTPFTMRHRPAGTRAHETVHPTHRCPGIINP